jgi:hypothetical protein
MLVGCGCVWGACARQGGAKEETRSDEYLLVVVVTHLLAASPIMQGRLSVVPGGGHKLPCR